MSTKTLTDPDGDAIEVRPGPTPGTVGVAVAYGSSPDGACGIPAADLIAAIREAAGETDAKPEPAPAPSKPPTAEDFAKAQFARHEDGSIAARLDDDSPQWRTDSPSMGVWHSDAEMAAEGWSIVTPAPSNTTAASAREYLEAAWEAAHVPSGDTIPARVPCIERNGLGGIQSIPRGHTVPMLAVQGRTERRLFDPPAPVTPAWHNAQIVEARVLGGDRCQWASTSDGMWVSLDGSNFAAHRDYLRDVRAIVPEEVEA